MWLFFQNLVIFAVMASFIYNDVDAPGLSGPVVAIFVAWLLTKILSRIIDRSRASHRPKESDYTDPSWDL